jgi:hypothetical protein
LSAFETNSLNRLNSLSADPKQEPIVEGVSARNQPLLQSGEKVPSFANEVNLIDRTETERNLQAWICALSWTVLALFCASITFALLRHRLLLAVSLKRRIAIQVAVSCSTVMITVLTGLYLVPTLRDAVCLWF